MDKLSGLLRDNMDWLMGKGRRKEKDADTAAKPYLADELVTKRISNFDLERLVESPQGLDYNEWLATHTISFFEHLNLLYGSVSEYCNSTVCSSMTGPNNMQYLYVDGKGKKCKCAAPQYVDYVMLNTEQTLNDEAIFPTKYGNTFPAQFDWTVRRIMTSLYHVIAHLYHAHYKEVVTLCLHAHLNTLFLHFSLFCKRHNLLEEKETEVLDDLFEKLRQPTPVTSTENVGVEGGQGDSAVTQTDAAGSPAPASSSPLASTSPTQPSSSSSSSRPQGRTVSSSSMDDTNKENNQSASNNSATKKSSRSASTASSTSSCANGAAGRGGGGSAGSAAAATSTTAAVSMS